MKKTIDRIEFTKKMKKDYKLLMPAMAPIHFELLKNIFTTLGYNIEMLENCGKAIRDEGLKHVHNDTCYPATLVIGQFIDALKSGKYDLTKTALLLTQTGGGCRASNYIFLLRKALKKAGFEYIPVVSVNISGMEKNSGFKINFKTIRKLLAAIIYGDALMNISNQLMPYEKNPGDTKSVLKRCIDDITAQFYKNKGFRIDEIEAFLNTVMKQFSAVELVDKNLVKAGVVGEIYVKFCSIGNNDLEKFLFEHGCEVIVPGLMNFVLYTLDSKIDDIILYGGSALVKKIFTAFLNYILKLEQLLIKSFVYYEKNQANNFKLIKTPYSYKKVKKMSEGIIGYGNKMGEGWLLTAEMIELCGGGCENIVCTQPFGCLPNHISGKGMMKKIKEIYINSNIVAIDYDPSSSTVNQENRIKLMLAVAKENLLKVES